MRRCLPVSLTEARERKNRGRVFPLLFALLALCLLTACAQRSESAPEAEESAPAESVPAEPEEAKSDYEYLPETAQPQEPEEAPEPTPEEREAALDAKLRARIAGMSAEEKVGQLFFVRCPAADAAEKIARYHLGGVLLFTRDYQDDSGEWLSKEAFIAKLDELQDAARGDLGIPLFIGSDEEGGTVTRASRNPNLFPAPSQSPQALFAAGGIGAVVNDAAQKSYLLRELGINVNFAPVCDVAASESDFIYDRTLGQDAETTADCVARVVGAMNSAGVGSVLKHFPGYGNNGDTHTGSVIDERAYEHFDSVDFLPFEAGIEAGAPFVLVCHNIVTSMDATLPASLSPTVHRILRGGLGFDGVILTDDLSMAGATTGESTSSVAVLAVKAGNDMLVTEDFETQIADVLDAVEYGSITPKMLDDACYRILRAKCALGLLSLED